jgi:hypothetical protein
VRLRLRKRGAVGQDRYHWPKLRERRVKHECGLVSPDRDPLTLLSVDSCASAAAWDRTWVGLTKDGAPHDGQMSSRLLQCPAWWSATHHSVWQPMVQHRACSCKLGKLIMGNPQTALLHPTPLFRRLWQQPKWIRSSRQWSSGYSTTEWPRLQPCSGELIARRRCNQGRRVQRPDPTTHTHTHTHTSSYSIVALG